MVGASHCAFFFDNYLPYPTLTWVIGLYPGDVPSRPPTQEAQLPVYHKVLVESDAAEVIRQAVGKRIGRCNHEWRLEKNDFLSPRQMRVAYIMKGVA